MRFLRIAIGLCAAAFVAALLLTAPLHSTIDARRSAGALAHLVGNLRAGMLLTTLVAGLPMIYYAILAECMKWRHWSIHVGTGFALGSIMPILAAILGRDTAFLVAGMIWIGGSGAAGGLTYWAIAGRSAGSWKEAPTAPVS